MPHAVPNGRKLLLLAVFATVVICGAWWLQRPPPEPESNGQGLSEWLNTLERHPDDGLTVERIHTFGPGALPWLIYTAEYGRHPFQPHGPLPFDKAPDWLRRRLPAKWGGLRPSSRIDDRVGALLALQTLGPEAAPAIPALARVLDRECEAEMIRVAILATEALHAVGPASWPAVDQILEHGKPQARMKLLWTICVRMGSLKEPAPEAEGARAAATVIKACGNPNASMRVGAMSAIATCCEGPDPVAVDAAIPEAVKLLSDPDAAVRTAALQALAHVGRKSPPTAIPRLIEMLDDESFAVRINAADALGQSDRSEKRSAPRLRFMFAHDPDPRCRGSAGGALAELGLAPAEHGAGGEALPAR